jgi:hypothetical protein
MLTLFVSIIILTVYYSVEIIVKNNFFLIKYILYLFINIDYRLIAHYEKENLSSSFIYHWDFNGECLGCKRGNKRRKKSKG